MKKLIFPLFLSLFFIACNDGAEFQTKISDMENQLAEAQTKLAEAEAALASVKSPGLVHSVFFWLKDGLSEADEAAFVEGVKSLATIETVKACHIGPPAPTEARDVVDNSFSYALLVHFENVEDQNAYQVDPIHLKFIEDHAEKWGRVVVYDNVMVE